MSQDIESVKELLRVYLSQIQSELDRLANNYDALTSSVRDIERNTDISIAEIRKDINSLGTITQDNKSEIKAIKTRLEVGEDVQQVKWTEQDIRNKGTDKKDNTILGLLITAITIVLGLVITTIWKIWFP
jgi:hypothetical protein